MNRSIALARPRGHIACATIVPGYDDTKIRNPGARLHRADGRLYDAQWQVALETLPDWILITSFNEWHEGSEIEPSAELGDKYLKATARWTQRWRASAAPSTWRNRDGKGRTWFHPRACMLPGSDGKPVALMNLQESCGEPGSGSSQSLLPLELGQARQVAVKSSID